MNEDIKNKWVRALRSGEYRQTKTKLKNQNGYCCLGVLCELYSKETKNAAFSSQPVYWCADGTHEILDEVSLLPVPIIQWAEMKSSDGNLPQMNSLAYQNDYAGSNFEEIADYIEKYWEVL